MRFNVTAVFVLVLGCIIADVYAMGSRPLSVSQQGAIDYKSEGVHVTVYRLIGERDGKKTCEGFRVISRKGKFKKKAIKDHISIIEGKHVRETMKIMEVINFSDRKFDVLFRKGMGDFGTGNVATIRIPGVAVEGSASDITIKIGTDLND